MKLLRQAGELVKIIIISLLIIVPIRYFVAQPFVVRGASMAPAFEDGEYLIIDELSYRFSGPERGDVVVFRFPLNTSQFYIKRIVGLPDEKVMIKNGSIVISNDSQEVPLDESMYLENGYTAGDIEIDLQDEEYFVLGDNRNASSDSRRWGALDDEFIVGKVFLRAWPVERFTMFR